MFIVIVVNGEGPTLSPTVSIIIIVGGDESNGRVIKEFMRGDGTVAVVTIIINVIK